MMMLFYVAVFLILLLIAMPILSLGFYALGLGCFKASRPTARVLAAAATALIHR